MVTEKTRKVLTDAMYLKRHGWSFKQQDGIWGYIDPKSKVHYAEEAALLLQLVRDTSTKRFGPEPLYHD
jgi:hypothetical protein